MNTTRLAAAVLAVLAIAGCEGGGVDLNVETVDNSVDNSTGGGGGGGGSNPCATYTPPNSNESRIGTFDGTNCVYSAAFVGKTNPLLVDLTIPFISGVHIFQDSLFVGQDVTSAAPAGGEGPTLTIAAGNTLAFSNSADYVLINRGSQIIAEGSPTAPITLSTATVSPTTVPTPNGPRTSATSNPRASPRTMAATTTPTIRACCATSSSSTRASRSHPGTS
jgi:hypothetical protein